MKKTNDVLHGSAGAQVPGGSGSSVKKKKRIRIVPMIIALVLSFLLWNYVMMVESPMREATFESIPITVISGDNTLSVISGEGTLVNVTVSGRKSLTNTVTEENFTITADISQFTTAGEYTVPLKITVPDGLTLVASNIDAVLLYLDNKTAKTVPVTVEYAGDYSIDVGSGYELEDASAVELSSAEINVTGPESVLARIDHARFAMQLEGKITSSVRYTGTPVLVDAEGNAITNSFVTTDVPTITAMVRLYRTKEVSLTVSYKHGFFNQDNTEAKLSPATVTVRGIAETVETLSTLSVSTVDEKDPATSFTASLTLPEGVSVIDEVGDIAVTLSHTGLSQKTLTIPDTDIKIVNPDSISYAFSADALNLKLMGIKESLDAIGAADVTATVDLSGIGALNSATSVPVTIEFGDAYEGLVWELGEYTLLVAPDDAE